MRRTLTNLLEHLSNPAISNATVITWGAPVPVFGDLFGSSVATLGLNPSNREFVDSAGNELDAECRRFHTLGSLGLNNWREAELHHLKKIEISCKGYFSRNPYDLWFRALDQLISGTTTSYYAGENKACHLDLIPYATSKKWMELTTKQRSFLLELSGNSLACLLRDSPIQLLVLNGSSVINSLRKISPIELDSKLMPGWTLPRNASQGVNGYAFTGVLRKVSGIDLKRDVQVVGFNHNIQSSFGVTTEVKSAIKNWIAKSSKGLIK